MGLGWGKDLGVEGEDNASEGVSVRLGSVGEGGLWSGEVVDKLPMEFSRPRHWRIESSSSQ